MVRDGKAKGVHVGRVVPHDRCGRAVARDAARPRDAYGARAAAMAHEHAVAGLEWMREGTSAHGLERGVAGADFVDVAGEDEVRFERGRVRRHVAGAIDGEAERVASALYAAPERTQVESFLVGSVAFGNLLQAVGIAAGVGDEVAARLALWGGEIDGERDVHVPVVRA